MNLSPKSYMDEALVPEVKRIMQQYNVQTNQIWFELTEFADVQDKDALRKIVVKLTNQASGLPWMILEKDSRI